MPPDGTTEAEVGQNESFDLYKHVPESSRSSPKIRLPIDYE
jgi:hypothetical protein